MSAIDGGNFLSGFAAGAVSSIISSGVELFADLQNMFVFLGDKGISDNAIKAIQIAAGGLSGGISASIAGGNFWSGARQGIITSGLNNVASNISNTQKKKSLGNQIDEVGGNNESQKTKYIFLDEEIPAGLSPTNEGEIAQTKNNPKYGHYGFTRNLGKKAPEVSILLDKLEILFTQCTMELLTQLEVVVLLGNIE
jgi:hypothetical protein